MIIGNGQAADFVYRSGRNLMLGGQTIKFVGFNYRGMSHYGYGDVLRYSYASDRTTELDFTQSIGAKVVRVFASYRGITKEQTGDRLEVLLNQAGARNVHVMPSLIDIYAVTGLCPQGDENSYANNGGWDVLSPAFFTGGFRTYYLPQAQYLAQRFKDRPEIFAWELGNEIMCNTNPSAFVSFCKEAARVIKTADPNHLINTGMICGAHSALSSGQTQSLYGDANIDIVSGHFYDNNEPCNDTSVAVSVNKPMVIGEAGFSSGDRPGLTNADIADWINNRGASGYMQWGVTSLSRDNGDGDAQYGMDNLGHANDFNSYCNVYRQWAQILGAWPTGGPTVTPGPPTSTPAPTATRSGDCGQAQLLSAGKTAYGDSTYSGNYPASKLTDGVWNCDTCRWVSGTGSPHWCYIDLGAQYELCSAQIYVDEAWNGDSDKMYNLTKYTVRGSNNTSGGIDTWTVLATFDGGCTVVDYPGGQGDAHNEHNLSGVYRYVGLHITGNDSVCNANGNARVQELRVFGVTAGNTPTSTIPPPTSTRTSTATQTPVLTATFTPTITTPIITPTPELTPTPTDGCHYHTSDKNHDWQIDFSLALLLVSRFNSGGAYSCGSQADGYQTGSGDQTCGPHDADNNQNWVIDFSEMLRFIQFFNMGYHCQTGTVDGFAPGPM